MNPCRPKILFALAMGLAVACGGRFAAGQSATDDPLPPAEPLPKSSAAIEYVGPDTFILLDRGGRPQSVLGMSYEEFVAAWKKIQQVEGHETEPRFTIEDLRIQGETRGDNAELSVEIVVRSIAGGALKIPLGMEQAILLSEPQFETIGGEVVGGAAAKSFVSSDADEGGFVAWIDAPSGERRKLKLKLVRPLTRDGNQTSLAMNLPRALVSRLALTVPDRVVSTTATDGVTTMQALADEQGTRLEVDGPRGEFRLSWTTSGSERPELTSVISATGAVAISIDGHSIRSDALLTVRSYGGSFDRFRVRLPPGAQLIEDTARTSNGEAADYRVLVDETSGNSSAGAESGSQVVTVELAEKQVGPVEVRLSTEQPLGLTAGEPAIELAGFEVIGAVRQFGDVAIAVADDWQLRWENGPYVRQVERGELAETLRSLPTTVAFQYDRQPWSLRAQIVARPMVVHVTPQYSLSVDREEARLQVRLDYQVPGARAFEFRVRLNGWELTPEPIESNGLVDRDRAVVGREGELMLPLSQASPRRANIEFILRRPLGADGAAVNLPLPAPEADTVAPAELAVIVDNAIELVPDMAASRGLAPVPIVDDVPLQAGSGGEQHFAFRSFAADASFAARRSLRPREVTTHVETRLSIKWEKAVAVQDAAFDVRYQPLSELAFELPHGWSIVDDQIEIISEDSAAQPLVASVVVEPETHGRPTRIARALLAQPRLGKFRVHAAYEFDEQAGAADARANYLKLPRPVASRVSTQRVEVVAAEDISLAAAASPDTPWQSEANSGDNPVFVLTGSSANVELPLEVGPFATARPQAIVVDRVWLQMWQAGRVIQDRAVIHFRSGETVATVELPPNSTASEVEVLVDGKIADTALEQEGRIHVSLPVAEQRGSSRLPSHTLELRYRRSAPAGLVTRIAMTPPQLVGSSALCDVYWHIVLPGDRHVVQTSDMLSPVDPAQWLEVVLGRAAMKSQAELEEWVDATRQPGPAATQNTYLFSALAPVSIELVTAPRWLLVLAASGGVLLVTSAWIYLPAVRRGWIAIVAAVVVAALAVAFPTQAVLVGQAAVLGMAVSVLATVLRRWSGAREVFAPLAAAGSTNLRMRFSPAHRLVLRAAAEPDARSPARPASESFDECNSDGSFGRTGIGSMRASAETLLCRCRSVATLAALVVSGWNSLGRCDEPAQAIRRVLVPAENPESWPRDGKAFLPVEASDFEGWLKAANEPASSASIVDAEYHARFVAGKLVDTHGHWQVRLAGNHAARLPLEDVSLLIRAAKWRDRQAAAVRLGWWPSSQNGEVLVRALEVPQSGVLDFEWSTAAQTADESWSLPLDLPPAARTRLILDLPAGKRPDVDGSAVVESPTPPEEGGRWILALSTAGPQVLRIENADGSESALRSTTVRQFTRYAIRRGGLDAEATIELSASGSLPQSIVVVVPAWLSMVSAECGDETMPWRVIAQPAGRMRRVSIKLPATNARRTASVILKAWGPLVVDEPQHLPLLAPEGVFWAAGEIELSIDEALELRDVSTTDCIQTEIEIVDSAKSPARQLCFAAYGLTAALEIEVRHRRSLGIAETGASLELGGSAARGQVVSQIRVERGQLHQLSAKLRPGWVVDAVETVPADLLREWYVDLNSEPHRLCLQLDSATTPGKPLRVVTTAHSSATGIESVAVADLNPLAWQRLKSETTLLELQPAEQYDLEVQGVWNELLRDMLAAEQRELLSGAEGARLSKIEEGAEATIRLVPKRIAYDATVQIAAALLGDRCELSYEVVCTPAGGGIDHVLLFFAEPPAAPIQWIDAESERPLKAEKMPGSDPRFGGLPTGGELRRLEFGRLYARPIKIAAKQSIPWRDRRRVPLVSLPDAAAQQGRITIANVGSEPPSIVAQKMAPAPLPLQTDVATPVNEPAVVRAVYRFQPTRLYDSAAVPQLSLRPAGTSGGERLIVAGLDVESRFAVDGSGVHRAVYRINNQGAATFDLSFPRGVILANARVDGAARCHRARATAGPGAAAAKTASDCRIGIQQSRSGAGERRAFVVAAAVE